MVYIEEVINDEVINDEVFTTVPFTFIAVNVLVTIVELTRLAVFKVDPDSVEKYAVVIKIVPVCITPLFNEET
jgi:hypothetical protein